MDIELKNYGFDEHFAKQATQYDGLFAARVSEQHRDLYKVVSAQGEVTAGVSGKLAFGADDATRFPAVGDWVMINRMYEGGGKAVIHHLLPRKSVLVRGAAGTGQAGQIIAANIDTIFICMALTTDYNLRRLERYLALAWSSRATPIIVLTKADLCDDLAQKLDELALVCMGAPVIACSSATGQGYQEMAAHIKPGHTVAFIGSSGVGKSTCINRLLGREALATREVREGDGKGRHTTTHRQLLLLPGGGIVIDTPGMRELQIYTGNLSKTFEDIEELAARCKFADCTHGAEPGCAVRQAIESGALSEERFESHQKLQREPAYSGLNARQTENEKINRMFGSKNELKRAMKDIKQRKHR